MIDSYGNMLSLHPDACEIIHITPSSIILTDSTGNTTGTITNDVFDSIISKPIHQHIVIEHGATWSIHNKQLSFINGAVVTISNDAQLRLTGSQALLKDADLNVRTNGKLRILEGGKVQFRKNSAKPFHSLRNMDLGRSKIFLTE